MSDTAPTPAALASLQETMEPGIDYAVRVANDVASTMQAILDVSKRMDKQRYSDVPHTVMAASIEFTSASIADFLKLSKTLLHASSAQDYYDIQHDFFQSRASATRGHFAHLAGLIVPPE